MDAANITFGVEIECYVPAGCIMAGEYHRGLPIPGFPVGWNAQRDGSLRSRRRDGREGMEIVSPILKGIDGVKQVKEVLAKLSEMGAKVSPRCGFHVHVGFGQDTKNLGKLVHLAANFEKAIYATTGTKNRERGQFCRPISGSFRTLRFNGTVRNIGPAASDRYHVLNVSNVFYGTKQTVEFRAFAGTLNFEKIVAYIRLCVGMVERALKMKRPTNWQANTPVATSPIHRKGEGQTQLTRLFYQLGWTKGRQDHTHGDLSGEGVPTMQKSKRTLMKLARQYDRGA